MVAESRHGGGVDDALVDGGGTAPAPPLACLGLKELGAIIARTGWSYRKVVWVGGEEPEKVTRGVICAQFRAKGRFSAPERGLFAFHLLSPISIWSTPKRFFQGGKGTTESGAGTGLIQFRSEYCGKGIAQKEFVVEEEIGEDCHYFARVKFNECPSSD